VQQSEPSLPKVNELDLVRLILAAAVVCQHASTLAGAPSLGPLSSIPAVPIFIYLSGLLVSESLKRSQNTLNYLNKRIRRIFPAYITVVVIGGLLAWVKALIASSPGVSIKSLISYLANNLSFLNFRYPCAYPIPQDHNPNYCAINGSLWSIKYELIFYLLLPLLFALCTHSNRNLSLKILGIGALLALSINNNHNIHTTIALCFLVGVGASHWKTIILNNLKKLPTINPWVRSLATITVAGLSGAGIPLTITLCLITVAAFYPTKPNKPAINILRFGDLSYGIYLIHFPLIQIFISSLPADFRESHWCQILSLGASVILAILLYQTVEKRFLGKSSHYITASP